MYKNTNLFSPFHLFSNKKERFSSTISYKIKQFYSIVTIIAIKQLFNTNTHTWASFVSSGQAIVKYALFVILPKQLIRKKIVFRGISTHTTHAFRNSHRKINVKHLHSTERKKNVVKISIFPWFRMWGLSLFQS